MSRQGEEGSFGASFAAEQRMRAGALNKTDRDILERAKIAYQRNIDVTGPGAFVSTDNYVRTLNETTKED